MHLSQFKFVALFFLICQIAYAVSTPENSSGSKIDVFEMKRKLQARSNQIYLLGKEISTLENQIGVQNKKFNQINSERGRLEEEINTAKRNADFDSLNLKKNLAEVKSMLTTMLLNRLEKTETAADLLARKVILQNLANRSIELEGLIKQNKFFLIDVEKLEQRLADVESSEKEVLALLKNLEDEKRAQKEQLELEVKSKTEEEANFKNIKNKLAMETEQLKRQKKRVENEPLQITEEIKVGTELPKVQLLDRFKSPLMAHKGIEYKEKGVTYKFVGKNEVLATKPGRVTHIGPVANYGNVVIIDHGKELRSVIFGQFDYVVNRGDAVSEGQVLGYTNASNNQTFADGKIYFEVRKNNIAQNTYLLLERK